MLQTVLRLSVVCCLSVTLGHSWLNARPIEQKLLLTTYRNWKSHKKSTGTKINDLDLCLELEVVSRSCQPLRHLKTAGCAI